jgi:hypothetical protein
MLRNDSGTTVWDLMYVFQKFLDAKYRRQGPCGAWTRVLYRFCGGLSLAGGALGSPAPRDLRGLHPFRGPARVVCRPSVRVEDSYVSANRQ